MNLNKNVTDADIFNIFLHTEVSIKIRDISRNHMKQIEDRLKASNLSASAVEKITRPKSVY